MRRLSDSERIVLRNESYPGAELHVEVEVEIDEIRRRESRHTERLTHFTTN